MKTIATIVAIAFGLALSAQVPSGLSTTIEWGEAHDIDGDQTIAHVDSNFTYAYAVNNGEGFNRKKWIFTKYNTYDFSIEWQIETKPLEYKEDGELSFREVRILNGDFYIFYSSYHKDDNTKVLLGQRIDAEGVMGDLIPLGTIETDDEREGEFRISWANDYKTFATSAVPQFIRDSEKYVYTIRVFDREMNELWSHKEVSRVSNENFGLQDFILGTDGKVYALTYTMPDRERGGRDAEEKSNQHYRLFRITKDVKHIEDLDLQLDDYFVTSPWIYVDDHKMQLGGMYSTEDFDQAEGFFYMIIDTENFSIATRSDNKIPEAIAERFVKMGFFESFLSFSSGFNSDFGKPFRVARFVRRDDGGVLLALQVRYTSVRYETTVTVMGVPVAWRPIYTYHYEDILLQSIDPNGTLEWTAHIPLKQTMTETEWLMGIFMIANGDKLHLIFNDDSDNMAEWSEVDPSIDVYPGANIRNDNVVMITVNTKGDLYYETIAPVREDEEKTYFIPRACGQLGKNSNTGVVFSMRGDKVRLGRLTIN